ncbi:hypothetical protein T484DRAFT_1988839 [Baffinella frigidus]|nr:hypothetical protein T484DRAFT_1988839 [Cryptophyta sp. CCMP2293]
MPRVFWHPRRLLQIFSAKFLFFMTMLTAGIFMCRLAFAATTTTRWSLARSGSPVARAVQLRVLPVVRGRCRGKSSSTPPTRPPLRGEGGE